MKTIWWIGLLALAGCSAPAAPSSSLEAATRASDSARVTQLADRILKLEQERALQDRQIARLSKTSSTLAEILEHTMSRANAWDKWTQGELDRLNANLEAQREETRKATLPHPHSRAEYELLPVGTTFIDPEGVERTKAK